MLSRDTTKNLPPSGRVFFATVQALDNCVLLTLLSGLSIEREREIFGRHTAYSITLFIGDFIIKTMTYKQAKYALIGYNWITGWKIVAEINEKIGFYAMDVIGEDGQIKAYAIVSKETAERLKKEWNL